MPVLSYEKIVLPHSLIELADASVFVSLIIILPCLIQLQLLDGGDIIKCQKTALSAADGVSGYD